MKFLFGNSLWQLIVMSDAVSKLVLLTLFGMSIVCWTIFLYKVILSRLKKRQIADAFPALKKVGTLQELLNLSSAFSATLPGYFLSHNLTILKSFLQRRDGAAASITEQEWDELCDEAEDTLDDIVHHEHQYMPILYSFAGVSTLMGLFGTVWGLVHSFIRISEKQSADITTVAPGIAEALLTTLAGLIVAIPAFLMFHYLENDIRQLEYQLSKFVDRYCLVLKSLFRS